MYSLDRSVRRVWCGFKTGSSWPPAVSPPRWLFVRSPLSSHRSAAVACCFPPPAIAPTSGQISDRLGYLYSTARCRRRSGRLGPGAGGSGRPAIGHLTCGRRRSD